MTALIDQSLVDDLRRIAMEAVGADGLIAFEVEPYVDHYGEDALKVLIEFSDARFDGVDRIGLISDLLDHLRGKGLDLFPYPTFARQGEAA